MTKKKKKKTQPTLTHAVSMSSMIVCCPTWLNVLLSRSLSGLFYTVTVTWDSVSSLEISVTTMGNKSLSYFPKTVPWSHIGRWVLASVCWPSSDACSVGILSDDRKALLSSTLWPDLRQRYNTLWMASKSIANKLNVQTLVWCWNLFRVVTMILKSVQKFTSIMCQSELKMNHWWMFNPHAAGLFPV